MRDTAIRIRQIEPQKSGYGSRNRLRSLAPKVYIKICKIFFQKFVVYSTHYYKFIVYHIFIPPVFDWHVL